MIKIKDVVTDTAGNAIAQAKVTILTYPGGANAVLYDKNGDTLASNVLTTDAFGGFECYLANGHYSRRIEKAGASTVLDEDIYYIADVAGIQITEGKTASFKNTLTLQGTDGTTHTLPATDSTLARIDAAQTFAGTQSFAALVADSLTTTDAASIGGGLDVAGPASFATINTTGDITGGTLHASGTATLATVNATTLTSSAAASVGGDLSVNGAVTLSGVQNFVKGSTALNNSGGATPKFQIAGTSFDAAAMMVSAYVADGTAPTWNFVKSRGAAPGVYTVVQSGDVLGAINFEGSTGSALARAASISAGVDGTPGVGDMPGRLSFSTSLDGAATPVEHLRITNDGTLAHKGAGSFTNVVNLNSHLQLRSYTVATLPAVGGGNAQSLIYVSDGTGNKRVAVSDGGAWRWMDGTIVS